MKLVRRVRRHQLFGDHFTDWILRRDFQESTSEEMAALQLSGQIVWWQPSITAVVQVIETIGTIC
jgi:hypothetical protein